MKTRYLLKNNLHQPRTVFFWHVLSFQSQGFWNMTQVFSDKPASLSVSIFARTLENRFSVSACRAPAVNSCYTIHSAGDTSGAYAGRKPKALGRLTPTTIFVTRRRWRLAENNIFFFHVLFMCNFCMMWSVVVHHESFATECFHCRNVMLFQMHIFEFFLIESVGVQVCPRRTHATNTSWRWDPSWVLHSHFKLDFIIAINPITIVSVIALVKSLTISLINSQNGCPIIKQCHLCAWLPTIFSFFCGVEWVAGDVSWADIFSQNLS